MGTGAGPGCMESTDGLVHAATAEIECTTHLRTDMAHCLFSSGVQDMLTAQFFLCGGVVVLFSRGWLRYGAMSCVGVVLWPCSVAGAMLSRLRGDSSVEVSWWLLERV
jgi:hypothetical protein